VPKIIDFNTLWEIAFAINAIFVYFELTPALDRKFNGVNEIGRRVIDKLIEEQDRRYINSYGWRSLLFGYVIWVKRLKTMSVFNSIVAIFMVIIGGFNPETALNSVYIAIIIIILYIPILLIPAIILISFPNYKLKCIEEAVQKILDRDDSNPTILSYKKRRYKIAIEYIKITEFGLSFFVKRNKEFSDADIFHEIEELW
jgi:hypothetical protein